MTLLFLMLSNLFSFGQNEKGCEIFPIENKFEQITPMATGTYKSSNGDDFPTKGQFRVLTVFVNIIYDQTPLKDPNQNSTSNTWRPNTTSSINSHAPSYLLDLFDTEIKPTGYKGIITRFYAEASFNQFILLSDYIIINIKQSQITPNNPGSSFTRSELMNKVIAYINNNGGFRTYYGHNNISEYDKFTRSGRGLVKSMIPDKKIDLINFLLRNSTVEHGGVKQGSGYSGVTPTTQMICEGISYGYGAGTYQCIGDKDISDRRNILFHEIAHLLLGGNEAHTSGSVTNNDNYHNTFIGKQYGYGLFSGFLSINAYERWRLGWHYESNPIYPISVNSINSDINSKFNGIKEFTLRDFVTYGDAIRIKLPYKDNDVSSNQYIWIVNHQMRKNGKLDFHHPENTCIDADQAGIYTFYQIGKDILEGTSSTSVFPTNEKDNLRMISAEGNYNVEYLTQIDDCMGWAGPEGRPFIKYISPNPLQGISDQNEVICFPTNSERTSLVYPDDFKYMGAKMIDNVTYNNLPYGGDKYDAFVPKPVYTLDISSNPAPVNTTTYYSIRNSNMQAINTQRNTRKIYLTGLCIKMTDTNVNNTGMKAYQIQIRWDDYDIKQDVNWSGDIVLKEKLNLLSEKILYLEQNKTPYQMERDPVSNYCAPPTKFTCENNSTINLHQSSKVILKEKSSFILTGGSNLTLEDDAELIIESGSTLIIKSGANIKLNGSGKITVQSGGYICVEVGASINLSNYSSVIFMKEGAIYGVNPTIHFSTSCSNNISYIGSGKIIDGSKDIYIQNETLSSNRYIGGRNIYVGKNVTPNKAPGDVKIINSANVIFEGENVTFEDGFECTSNSSYEVK